MIHPYDLGVYFNSINSASNEPETWLNRGMVWLFGFDLEMSFRCFKQASQLNPNYAMAYWGMALYLGSLLQQTLG